MIHYQFLMGCTAAVLLAACGSAPNAKDAQLLTDHSAMLAADSAMQAVRNAREDALHAVFKMWETGNVEGAEAYIAEGYVEHTAPPGMEVKGVQGFKDMVNMMSKSWSGIATKIHSIAHNGDMMFVHYNWAGKNTGEIMPGVPPTGKQVDADGVEVLKFDGAMTTDHWGYYEEAKMMTQLGMMPDLSAPPATKKK